MSAVQRRVAIGAGVVVLALVIAQLIGPPLAEKRVRAILDDNGQVSDVSVSAFPAIKLLLMRADEVDAGFSTLQLGTGDIGEQLEESKKADEVRVTIDNGTLGPLELTDLEYRKDGDRVSGQATISEDTLRALNVTPIGSQDGQLVVQASLLGFSQNAVVSADDSGALVAQGTGLAGLAGAFTIFEDPAVEITGVSAAPVDGGFALSATGVLR